MSNKILVTRSSMPTFEEYAEEIKELFETHWLTNMGPKHIKLEEELAKYLDIKKENIALFVNGHQALECIIEALGLVNVVDENGEKRDEVITTPFTFASTTNAIVRKGLKPVYCDIKESDYTIDETKIEELITDKTIAIIPVHVYGNICNTEAIEKIAKKHNLKVIYDAAHAFAVEKNGISSAKLGDASMFSFHATKVYNTIEGGAVCFKDSNLKQVLNNWKNFGIRGPEEVEYAGGNAKMNEFAAAMGICNLRHLDDEIAKRKAVADRYTENLKGIDGVKLNEIPDDVKFNYAYYPVFFDKEVLGVTRDDVFAALEAEGIGARKYFYPLTNTYDCYSDHYDMYPTPTALKISLGILTLPMYADLQLEDVDRICDIIKKTVKA